MSLTIPPIDWNALTASPSLKSQGYYNQAQIEKISEVVRKRSPSMCQIVGRGTGCLLKGGLLLTNYHVLPNKAACTDVEIRVFSVIQSLASSKEVITKTVNLALDPDIFFHSSPDRKNSEGKPLPALAGALDYTIVGVRRGEERDYLDQVPLALSSILDHAEPIESRKGILIQHPNLKDPDIDMVGTLQVSIGAFGKSYGPEIHYSNVEAHGSSGGIVFDLEGRPTALNYQGGGDCKCSHETTPCARGIIIRDVAESIPEEKIRIMHEMMRESEKRIGPLKAHYLRQSTLSVFRFKKRGKWELQLPIEKLYTRLALITEEERREKNEKLEASATDGRLQTYETISKVKESIRAEEIFTHEKIKGKKRKRIVVFGAAGIGKTTFTKHVIYQWAKRALWPEFEMVLCLPLRNLTKNFYPKERGYVYRAADLLQREYHELGVSIHSLMENQDVLGKTLLILDGYDELPNEASSPRQHLYAAFEELKEVFPHILVTSRPGEIGMDREHDLEILGFDEIRVEEYTDHYFTQMEENHELDSSQKAEKIKNLRDYLDKNPLARSLAQIPLNLSLLCSLFLEDAMENTEQTSISSLYHHLISHFYKWFLLRKNLPPDEVRKLKVIRFHKDVKPVAEVLERIADLNIQRGTLYIEADELEEIAGEKGLSPKEIEDLGLFKIEAGKGSFIHLTFQEYLAAAFVSRQTDEEIRSFVVKNRYNPRYQLVLVFLHGLIYQKDKTPDRTRTKKLLEALHAPNGDLTGHYQLELTLRCLEECTDPQIVQWIEERYCVYESLVDLVEEGLKGNEELLDRVISFFRNYNIPADVLEKTVKKVSLNIGSLGAVVGDHVLEKLYEKAPAENFSELLRALKPLLTDKKDEVRKIAVSALGKLCKEASAERFSELLGVLKPLLADKKDKVRESAVWALKNLCQKASAERFSELLGVLSPLLKERTVRYFAVLGLENLYKKISREKFSEAWEVLHPVLSDEKCYVRAHAVSALGELCKVAPVEKLSEIWKVLYSALSDKDKDVRDSAVSVLEKLSKVAPAEKFSGILEALNSLLNDDKEDVRDRAKNVLKKLCRAASMEEFSEILEALNSLLNDDKEDVRDRAKNVLRKLCRAAAMEKCSEMLEALNSLLSDEEGYVREIVASALEELCKVAPVEKCSEMLEMLNPLLSDEEEYVRKRRASALEELCKVGPVEKFSQMLEMLNPLLNDDEEYVRERGASALGKLCKVAPIEKFSQMLEMLNPLLSDEKWYVRKSAISALGELCRVAPIERFSELWEALIPFLRDEDFTVRHEAENALGKLCKGALEEKFSEILEPLCILLNNEEYYVHKSAKSVLSKLCKEVSTDKFSRLLKRLHILLSDEKKMIRESAADILRTLCEEIPEEKLPEVLEVLRPLLRSEEWVIRWTATQCLENLCEGIVPEKFFDFLEMPELLLFDEEYCMWEGISPERLSELLEILRPLLSDKEYLVRESAMRALKKLIIGMPEENFSEVLEMLCPLLSDEEAGVRSEAVSALKNLGLVTSSQRVSELLKALCSLLRDGEVYVCNSVLEILEKLCQEAKEENFTELLEALCLCRERLIGCWWPRIESSPKEIKTSLRALCKVASAEKFSEMLEMLRPDLEVRLFRTERSVSNNTIVRRKLWTDISDELELRGKLDALRDLCKRMPAEKLSELLEILSPLLSDQKRKVRSGASGVLKTIPIGFYLKGLRMEENYLSILLSQVVHRRLALSVYHSSNGSVLTIVENNQLVQSRSLSSEELEQVEEAALKAPLGKYVSSYTEVVSA